MTKQEQLGQKPNRKGVEGRRNTTGIAFTTEELAAMDAEALRLGVTRSEFVRRCIAREVTP